MLAKYISYYITQIFDREQSSEGPNRSFVDVALVVVGGESFWNEQKVFAMEQKMFLEQNYGIEMPCVSVYDIY